MSRAAIASIAEQRTALAALAALALDNAGRAFAAGQSTNAAHYLTDARRAGADTWSEYERQQRAIIASGDLDAATLHAYVYNH